MPDNNGYHVGPGVDFEMRRLGDKALDIERYINEYLSVTPGEKYLYIYHSIANVTYPLPKTVAED